MTLRFAIVVAVHNDRRTVDLVFTDTNLRVPEVSCLAAMVASDAGVWDVPSVEKPSDEAQAAALPQQGKRQLVAVVAEAYGRPFVLGFFHPLAGQMAFTEDDRFVRRHQSGAYSTIAPDGSIELWHPSGTYARIGSGAHQSLTDLSANKNWDEKTDADAPTITISMPGKKGEQPNFSLVVSPDGTVTLNTQKTLNATAQEGMNFSTPKTINFNAQEVHITAHVTVNGNIDDDGSITATGDVIGGGISLDHHAHEDDDNGPGVTGPPI